VDLGLEGKETQNLSANSAKEEGYRFNLALTFDDEREFDGVTGHLRSRGRLPDGVGSYAVVPRPCRGAPSAPIGRGHRRAR